MSILKEQTVYGRHNGVFIKTKTRRNGQTKKSKGQINENVGTKWIAGFIRRQTGLIPAD